MTVIIVTYEWKRNFLPQTHFQIEGGHLVLGVTKLIAFFSLTKVAKKNCMKMFTFLEKVK